MAHTSWPCLSSQQLSPSSFTSLPASPQLNFFRAETAASRMASLSLAPHSLRSSLFCALTQMLRARTLPLSCSSSLSEGMSLGHMRRMAGWRVGASLRKAAQMEWADCQPLGSPWSASQSAFPGSSQPFSLSVFAMLVTFSSNCCIGSAASCFTHWSCGGRQAGSTRAAATARSSMQTRQDCSAQPVSCCSWAVSRKQQTACLTWWAFKPHSCSIFSTLAGSPQQSGSWQQFPLLSPTTTTRYCCPISSQLPTPTPNSSSRRPSSSLSCSCLPSQALPTAWATSSGEVGSTPQGICPVISCRSAIWRQVSCARAARRTAASAERGGRGRWGWVRGSSWASWTPCCFCRCRRIWLVLLLRISSLKLQKLHCAYFRCPSHFFCAQLHTSLRFRRSSHSSQLPCPTLSTAELHSHSSRCATRSLFTVSAWLGGVILRGSLGLGWLLVGWQLVGWLLVGWLLVAWLLARLLSSWRRGMWCSFSRCLRMRLVQVVFISRVRPQQLHLAYFLPLIMTFLQQFQTRLRPRVWPGAGEQVSSKSSPRGSQSGIRGLGVFLITNERVSGYFSHLLTSLCCNSALGIDN